MSFNFRLKRESAVIGITYCIIFLSLLKKLFYLLLDSEQLLPDYVIFMSAPIFKVPYFFYNYLHFECLRLVYFQHC